MGTNFNSAPIGIPCPKCGYKTQKSIGWVKSNNSFVCVCGATINLDKNKFVSAIGHAERLVDDFKRKITRRM